jgi:DNA-directed RNA polymerase subunit RPC12/RpoP
MALINCPECGKEISDKAVSCPSCGVPINTLVKENKSDEEYLCCPKCMSKDLYSEHKGFSGGKALVGAVVAGGIGILAGTIGSKDVQVTCLKCGNKFKAGEARIVRTGSKADELEKRVLWLLCENKTIEARQLYESETHCTHNEAHSYILRLIEKVPENRTEEQKIKMREYYENRNKNGGCFGVIAILIIVSCCIPFII